MDYLSINYIEYGRAGMRLIRIDKKGNFEPENSEFVEGTKEKGLVGLLNNLNQVHNCDAIQSLKQLPDESIDLCVTDPPYILNKISGSSTSVGMAEKWQGLLKAGDKTAGIENKIRFKDWLPELYRVMKDRSHFYVFVNDKNVQDILNESTKVGFKLHNILVWKKNNKTPNKYYMKDCEFIVFFR